MLYSFSAIALMITMDMPPLFNPNSPSQAGLSAVPHESLPRAVSLFGPDSLMQAIANCTYRGGHTGRSQYVFTIDWGDGTVFSLTDNAAGQSCADKAVHRYAGDGPYVIEVFIAASGPTDRLDTIFHASTEVSF